jgi:hypothetical protein
MAERTMALLFVQPITLSLSLLQRMASNDHGVCKTDEEAESTTARKRLRLSVNVSGDDDTSNSSDLLEEEPEEEEEEEEEEEKEVSLEEISMNQLDTSKEKLYGRRARDILFSDDGDNPSTPLEPRTPESR